MSELAVACVGASWGGLDALRVILRGLPADLPAAICVVQHRGEDDPIVRFPQGLARGSSLNVCEPEDKQPIEPGTVYWVIVGAVSMPFVNSPEVRVLTDALARSAAALDSAEGGSSASLDELVRAMRELG